MEIITERNENQNLNINVITTDEPVTPPIRRRNTSPPPAPKANRRNRFKIYNIIPFPDLDLYYSTPDKKIRCLSVPPAPKINRFGNIKINDLLPRRLQYDDCL
jgi:hypothetical protein